jgi:spore maturation protein CgeB
VKILRVSNPYPAYLRQLYERRPELANASYTEQFTALELDGFGTFGTWQYYLPAAGHEVWEIAANVRPLQLAWAQENGVNFITETWRDEILWAQVVAFRPDLMVFQDYAVFSAAWILELRTRFPFLKRCVVWCGASYSDPAVFSAFDAVFSCVPELVEEFRNAGHQAFHLNHAFDPRVIERLPAPSGTPKIPASFIGQVDRRPGFHRERERLLLTLTGAVDLQIFSPAANVGAREILVYAAKAAGSSARHWLPLPAELPMRLERFLPKQLPTFPVHPRLRSRMRPPVFGLEMFRTLRDSLVTLNSHIDIASRSASNMRMFEATGVGTCLLTDAKSRLTDLFGENEVATYESPGECREKLLWLTKNPAEARKISAAGQARTLRDHTYLARLPVIDRLLQSVLEI